MMRYKTNVSNKLDQIKNLLDNAQRGLERRALSPEELLNKIKSALKVTDETIEIVDKENEEIR